MNRRFAGLIIISVALTSMIIWEFWGRENLSYEEVLVLKENIAANTVIKEKDLTVKKMENPSSSALSAEDLQWIVGKETVQYIAKGAELHKEFFCESRYAIGKEKGKYVLCVPEDWMLSFPKSIRRGDEVSFFNGKVKILDAVVVHSFDASGREVVSIDHERFNSEGTVNRIEIVSTADKLVELSNLAGTGKRFTVLYS